MRGSAAAGILLLLVVSIAVVFVLALYAAGVLLASKWVADHVHPAVGFATWMAFTGGPILWALVLARAEELAKSLKGE